jgi:hypothetical protein
MGSTTVSPNYRTKLPYSAKWIRRFNMVLSKSRGILNGIDNEAIRAVDKMLEKLFD